LDGKVELKLPFDHSTTTCSVTAGLEIQLQALTLTTDDSSELHAPVTLPFSNYWTGSWVHTTAP